MISDISIKTRPNQIQHKILSLVQKWFFLGRKFRYPLPRHSFNAILLSVNMKIHDSIGTKKFKIAINFAKT